MVDGFLNGGYAFLYRLALTYLLYLRRDILTAPEGSLVVLGCSFARERGVDWPRLIAASHELRLM